MEEKLKTLILADEHGFVDVFLEWLDAYDDTNITCMSDVISTLITEIEDNTP